MTTEIMVQIPLYVQKIIIKILCKHINRNNKLLEIIGRPSDYRINELEIRKLMMTISLVSKEWFKTISNNLNVSVDFNYNNNNKWSIIKQDNIKKLKLHCNHETKRIYELVNGQVKNIDNEIVNKKLENLSKLNTFKVLILRNINSKVNGSENEDIKLFQNSISSKVKLNLLKLRIDDQTSIETLKELEVKAKKVYSLAIGCCSSEIILKSLDLWARKLRSLEIEKPSFIGKELSFYELLVNKNYMQNVKVLKIADAYCSIREMVLLLEALNKDELKRLTIHICYSSLIYYLSTNEERSDINDSIRKCQCDINKKRRNGLFMDSNFDEQLEFNQNWPIFKELFKQLKSLDNLIINYDCPVNGGIITRKKPFPNSFVKEIGSLVSSNTSLTNFTFMSSITTQIFQEVLKTNKTITKFQALAVKDTCNFETCKIEINQLINNNQHINSFIITENSYNPSSNGYDNLIILNYNK